MQKLEALLLTLALTLSLTGAQAITFTVNTAIGVGNTTYDNQEIIVSGCTLTVDGPHAFTSLLVTNGGAVTHSHAPNGEANNRLNLTIAGDATVDATSAISVNGRGYGSDSGPGAGSTGDCGSRTMGGGAGHGGLGGATVCGIPGGPSYGSLLQPVTPGSGGGSPGGTGGGTVRMNVAGTLRVDGQLTANGADGPTGNYSAGGGGAGGSLWLTVGTLTGAGSISASGGQGFKNYGVGAQYTAGGGGGGRIAIEYGATTLTGTITATGASGNQRGGAGTIYRKAAAEPLGEVLIDNGGAGGAYTPVTTPVVFNLTIANHGYAYPTAALSVGNLQVATNGVLSQLSGQAGLNLTALGDATVAAGGAISADGAGYGSGAGPGAGGTGNCGSRTVGGGAGHGGFGGTTACGIPGGPSYGSLLQPVTPGSGGGSPGGAGGGTVRMSVAGTLRVDGQLTANGWAGTSGNYDAGGGGAGGSLWLTVGTLSGAGSISANGGQGGHNFGVGTQYTAGGGGGGRIAVEYGTNTLTGPISATGGIGDVRGGAGTVYRKAAAEPLGEVLIDNGGAGGAYTPLTTPSGFNLTIANHGYAYPTAALLVGTLRVASNGVLLTGRGWPRRRSRPS